jgi:hypothetical protein
MHELGDLAVLGAALRIILADVSHQRRVADITFNWSRLTCPALAELSAATSRVCAAVRPSALAVLRLITSSNLTGAWTGSSLGFAPLRMRPA